jgi:RNA polymerase sigma factor (sigma-70 family)
VLAHSSIELGISLLNFASRLETLCYDDRFGVVRFLRESVTQSQVCGGRYIENEKTFAGSDRWEITMVASQEPTTRTTDCATAMESRDDNSLLQAIVDRHDRDAFDELCKRHQVRAFNFALSILNDSALAHDAVQETMLSIWLSRKRIPQGMDAVAWILSIVTSKSSHLRRSQRRHTKREERFEMERSRSDVAVAEAVEGNELITVLRSHIDRLPDLERTVLGAAYCTSMSQQEIAKLVGVSQKTVSNKIQQALERLRMDLTKAGVAAVVPLLSRGSVFEAMTTGVECPPGMMEGITRRIENSEKAARAMSRRVVRHGGWALPAGIVAVLAAGMGGAWWLAQGRGNQVAADVLTSQVRALQAAPVKKSDERASNSEINSGRSDTPVLNYHWTFEKGAPSDIVVRDGVWHWNASAKLMEADNTVNAANTVILQLPGPLPRKAMMVQLRRIVQQNRVSNWGPMRSDGMKILRCRRWWIDTPALLTIGEKVVNTAYIVGRFVFGYRNDRLVYVSEFAAPAAEDRLVLGLENVYMEDLVFKEVEESALPKEVRENPQALLAALGWPLEEIGDQPLPPLNKP